MNRLRLIWLKLGELSPWIAAVGVILGGNWVADSVREGFELWIKGEDVVVQFVKVGYIVFFIGMVVWFYRGRNTLFQPRTRFLQDVESPEKREVLILFLSDLDLKRGKYNDGIPEGVTLSDDLDKDISTLEVHKTSNPFWRWEMPLRAIRHHIGRLQTIILLCSPESLQQVHWFRQILARYPSLAQVSVQVLTKENNQAKLIACPTTLTSSGGWEFERFDDLSRGVLHILKVYKKQSISEDQIMIDFTGGQKVTSVVAASVTFNRKIKAQYVQTNHPWNVVSYDILLGSPETGGLGI